MESNFWDSSTWQTFHLIAVLLLAILVANALKQLIPLLRRSLVPTSVLGFLSASIGGVIHLNILRVRGRVIGDGEEGSGIMNESIEDDNEIPMGGSMDKMTVQLTLIVIAYMLTRCSNVFLSSFTNGSKNGAAFFIIRGCLQALK